MEWFVVLIVAVLAMAIWKQHSSPVRRMPKAITPAMITPTDRPITRFEVAEAYRNFYIAHFDPTSGAELDQAEEYLLGYISSRIAELERERDETIDRLKRARRAHQLEKIGADDDSAYWDALPYNEESVSETVTRRQARLDAQNQVINMHKTDARHLLADYINEQISRHTAS